MKSKLIKFFYTLIALSLAAWYGLLLAQKIDLTTADLGRHIQNGSILLHGSETDKYELLTTNFYSYTNPNFPFVNHHWGSGVIFYLVDSIAGFKGLSIFYIILGALSFLIFFDIARREAGMAIATGAAAVLMPIMASRAEVRPEMFTYFFSGIFLWVLWQCYHKKIAARWLYALPVLILLWVNLHVGFFFGILLIGVFVLDDFIKTAKIRGRGFWAYLDDRLWLVLALCLTATLLNPNFIRGALYPLNIFKNYGYLIVENQSIRFLERIEFTAGQHFTLIKSLAITSAALLIAAAAWKRKFSMPYALLFLATAVMAYFGIRNFPFFGFFALPILAYSVNNLLPSKRPAIFIASVSSAAFLITLAAAYSGYLEISARGPLFGIGLLPGVNASAQFFKDNNIQGPIFNDYDIGGYLIYYLAGRTADKSANYHQDKTNQHESAQLINTNPVFVDNRPEAYPSSFFQNIYIPAQSDSQKWQELDRQYNFNAIFFSHRDYTPWAQSFLIARVQDPDWAPVFVDGYNIIFLKRTAQNFLLIQKYELPKSMFGVAK